MISTSVGLPNTCSQCGGSIPGGIWYAEHEDAARSGLGICPGCHAGNAAEPEPAPAPAPRKRSRKKEA